MAEAISGTVAWFNNTRGFGFIRRNDGQPDVFVHYSSISCDGYKKLDEGDEVRFSLGIGGPNNRQQAEGVVITRKANGHG